MADPDSGTGGVCPLSRGKIMYKGNASLLSVSVTGKGQHSSILFESKKRAEEPDGHREAKQLKSDHGHGSEEPDGHAENPDSSREGLSEECLFSRPHVAYSARVHEY